MESSFGYERVKGMVGTGEEYRGTGIVGIVDQNSRNMVQK